MNRVRTISLGLPLLICLTQLPIFLQLSLTPDTVLYDLQSQCVREGGVLYRDIVEPNLPGVVWVHSLVRWAAGPSPLALRLFDFSVVLIIAWVLNSFLISRRSVTALSVLLLFYLCTSEWCHCQRDIWMLLPCIFAVTIRRRFCCQPASDVTTSTVPDQSLFSLIAWCGFEGVLWAVGFWLKPFVAVPAIAVLLVSGTFLADRRSLGLQFGAVLSGGVVTGLAGIVWMIQSGCWPHFAEMLTSWNADYFQAGRSRWTFDRFFAHGDRFWPWIWLHVPAVGISVAGTISAVRKRTSDQDCLPQVNSALLGSLYLGWILQAFAFQQLFDYVHVPGIILAIFVCCQHAERQLASFDMSLHSERKRTASFARLIVPAGLIVAGLLTASTSPLRWVRQQHWANCVLACLGTPLSASMKDEIALVPFPRWKELQPMLDRIDEMNLPDQSVLAYNGNLIHLYPQSGFHAPTRFVYMDVLARCFPNRQSEMLEQLDEHQVRYVVSDLIEDGWEQSIPEHDLLPKEIANQSASMFFPYNQKPVFRSGSYVLFEIDRAPGWITSNYSPLADF